MEKTTEQLFNERLKRVRDAVALKKPDRVPLMPKMGNFYSRGYGISMYDTMKDLRNMIPGLRQFLQEYEPDMVVNTSTYPIDPLEETGALHMRWPGVDHNMPLDASYQILDNCFLEDDEYEEFILDPTHFILTKVYPRKFKNLKGFSKLYFRNHVELGVFADMAVFADPEVREAISHITRAGELWQKWAAQTAATYSIVEPMGFPFRKTIVQTCPFDVFADNIRGLINTVMDLQERPEEVEAALKVVTVACIERTVEACKARGAEFLYIPLHAGVDEFMSAQNYARFYWPGLKALMEAAIEIGVTPMPFCEGRYFTRFDFLKDVPKGKVVYQFEQTDMEKAAKELGGVACVCGNVSTTALSFGTPEQVSDEVKRLIDTCAGNGGFIMDCSITIDNVKHENLRAMFDTTMQYGKY